MSDVSSHADCVSMVIYYLDKAEQYTAGGQSSSSHLTRAQICASLADSYARIEAANKIEAGLRDV